MTKDLQTKDLLTKDALGDRMKADYENRTCFRLLRQTYTLIQVDGESFHSYTRRMRPGTRSQ